MNPIIPSVIGLIVSLPFVCSIWPIDRTLSGATDLRQKGPGSDGNKGVPHIPQSSSITGASSSNSLLSYPGHTLGESYSTAERQSVYSTAPSVWAKYHCCSLRRIPLALNNPQKIDMPIETSTTMVISLVFFKIQNQIKAKIFRKVNHRGAV